MRWWLARLSACALLSASVLAASGPLYVEQILDTRHLVVVTTDGEWLLLERRPENDPPGSPPAGGEGSDVPAAGRHVFASDRGTGTLLLDGERRRTAWVAIRSLGWNARKTIRYWLLIVAGALALCPLIVLAWRRFDAATDSTTVRYSHGPPPELHAGEVEAIALPRGWRSWVAVVSSAGFALLGIVAVSLMTLLSVAAPGAVDPLRRATPGVVLTDLAATSVGMVVVLWLFAGYASNVRQVWWSITRRVRLAVMPRVRTTATVRHAGTITIESGSDAGISTIHVLVYAFAAPRRGGMQTFVVQEAVSKASDLAVGASVEVEHVAGDPSVVRRV